jgi:hypothetical protein
MERCSILVKGLSTTWRGVLYWSRRKDLVKELSLTFDNEATSIPTLLVLV